MPHTKTPKPTFFRELSPSQQALLQILQNRLPQKPVSDWLNLEKRARENGVGPLLYVGCRRLGLTPPPQVADLLARTYAATALRNRQMLNALFDVGKALDSHGLEAMVLKGSSLILKGVYPDLGLRPMSDIDIWVPGANAAAARRHLIAENIATDFLFPELTFNRFHRRLKQEQWDRFGCNTHPCPLWLPDPKVRLEIHPHLYWTPSVLPRRLEAQIWASRKKRSDCPGLSLAENTHELLILLSHLMHHADTNNNFYLLRYLDAAKIWHPEMRAHVPRSAAGPLQLALSAFHKDAIDDSKGCAWPVQRLFWQPPSNLLKLEKPELARKWIRDRIGRCRQIPGTADRIRFVISAILPSPAFMRHRYGIQHNRWLGLAYAHRFLRHVWNISHSIFGKRSCF